MKKKILLITGLLFLGQAVEAAPAVRGRPAPANATQSNTTTVARSGRIVPKAAATAPKPSGNVVAARSATKQNVVQSGVAIQAATTNTIVSDECKTKYYGCMDSFCMLDNASGGRCYCSDKNSEFDNILAQIKKLDDQSRDMATIGVEKIELRSADKDKADYISETVQAVADEFTTDSSQPKKTTRTRASLDLSIFDSQPTFGFDAEETVENADLSLIQGKTGDVLHNTVRNICTKQIPECSKDIQMLQMMYAQTIQSDCRSYENYLQKMKDESTKKLRVAQQAMRDKALEVYEDANKWDLGQCVVEMRKCMQDTARGGCGNDWTGCVGIVAAENARSGLSSRTRTRSGMVSIEGSATKISIAASTYDALLSQKPLCESVTKNCVAAVSKDKDAVWNIFLREIAPALKSAELLAESNRRTDCIGNISECFRKGCADTMTDEASFDLCITRPEAMLNICKVQLNECGISTNSAAEAQKSEIWSFVLARLASMRVDSCTRDVKQCLQSEDRCGENYSQCVGLDMDDVMAMCPQEKLVGCAADTPQSFIDRLDEIVSGVLLGIDNAMQLKCQAAVDEKLNELRGEKGGYKAFSAETFGTEGIILDESHPEYVTIRGLIDFEKLTHDNKTVVAGTMDGTSASISNANLKTIANSINNVITQLKSDPKINDCVNGRDMTNIRKSGGQSGGRFPNLLDTFILEIINTGIDTARNNYNTKVNELKTQAMKTAQERLVAAQAKQAAEKNAKPPVNCISPGILFSIDYYKNKYPNVTKK
ncbi:MAG: hypothetical protein GX944_02820 [Alphaproteobacteria bacterium]|nr:hypothetical protein [Alphaproteobacteria bacterium]